MRLPLRHLATISCGLTGSLLSLSADYLDTIGLTDLRSRDASLDGSGVIVGQVESLRGGKWQTDPLDTGLPASTFTYFDQSSPYSTGTNFISSLESDHADRVGALFFGLTSGTRGYNGIAPGVDAIEMFFADYYYAADPTDDSIVRSSTRTQTNAQVVNQSFVFSDQVDFVDEDYDDYAALYNTLFCNGIFAQPTSEPFVATTITSPASSYNGIAVGVVDDTSVVPLADGRSKPDIVAPSRNGLNIFTSYTTPIVSGAATLLIQSGARGDAGAGTEDDATDIRTIKALLLNSATKPAGWSNTSTRPLDVINGAGIVNVNQAQLQLAAGQYSETEDNIVTSSGDEHLPPTNTNNIASNSGWSLSTLTNTSTGSGRRRTYYDSTDHYFFNCDATEASSFNLTATLVWNRNFGRTNINNLDLFLYTADGTLIASSVSTIDNVEHLYELNLEPGRYVLQVHKPASGRDSTDETYALAFNLAAGAPVAASNASANPFSSSTINLSWTDLASNETAYRIERRISGEANFTPLATLAADTESYTDDSCAAATTYEYQIIASNDNGDAPAAEASATTYSIQENWLFLNFGTTQATGDAADDADPEFDGIVNRIEFATGTDPNASSPEPVDASQLGSTRQFSFKWRNNSGLDFSIGYSENLTAGFTYYESSIINSGSSAELEFIGSTPIDSEFDTLTYGIKSSVTSDKAFIELQVVEP